MRMIYLGLSLIFVLVNLLIVIGNKCKMNNNYQVNSKLLPAHFPREFDAHIYFNHSQLDKATALRDLEYRSN